LLFLCKLNQPADQEIIKLLAMRLVAGQLDSGGWSYECPALTAPQAADVYQFSKDLGRRSLADYIRAHEEKWAQWPLYVQGMHSLQRPGWSGAALMGGPFRGGDNSNTQFATLALWAARRQNLPVERALDLIVTRFRNSQNPDGSWSYSGLTTQNRLPTMTGAGLLGMAVGYGL